MIKQVKQQKINLGKNVPYWMEDYDEEIINEYSFKKYDNLNNQEKENLSKNINKFIKEINESKDLLKYNTTKKNLN